MACIMSNKYESCQMVSEDKEVNCSGKPEEKAICPIWSGGLEKQSFRRLIRQPLKSTVSSNTSEFMKEEGY